MWTRSIMCKKRDAREKKVGGGGRGELSARDLQCLCVCVRARVPVQSTILTPDILMSNIIPHLT